MTGFHQVHVSIFNKHRLHMTSPCFFSSTVGSMECLVPEVWMLRSHWGQQIGSVSFGHPDSSRWTSRKFWWVHRGFQKQRKFSRRFLTSLLSYGCSWTSEETHFTYNLVGKMYYCIWCIWYKVIYIFPWNGFRFGCNRALQIFEFQNFWWVKFSHHHPALEWCLFHVYSMCLITWTEPSRISIIIIIIIIIINNNRNHNSDNDDNNSNLNQQPTTDNQQPTINNRQLTTPTKSQEPTSNTQQCINNSNNNLWLSPTMRKCLTPYSNFKKKTHVLTNNNTNNAIMWMFLSV